IITNLWPFGSIPGANRRGAPSFVFFAKGGIRESHPSTFHSTISHLCKFSWDTNDNLTYLCVRFEVSIGFDNLGEGKGLRGLRVKPSLLQAIIDIPLCGRKLVRRGRNFHQRISLNGQPIMYRGPDREWRRLPGKKAILENSSAACRRPGKGLEEGASDGVEDNPRAFSCGDFFYPAD